MLGTPDDIRGDRCWSRSSPRSVGRRHGGRCHRSALARCRSLGPEPLTTAQTTRRGSAARAPGPTAGTGPPHPTPRAGRRHARRLDTSCGPIPLSPPPTSGPPYGGRRMRRPSRLRCSERPLNWGPPSRSSWWVRSSGWSWPFDRVAFRPCCSSRSSWGQRCDRESHQGACRPRPPGRVRAHRLHRPIVPQWPLGWGCGVLWNRRASVESPMVIEESCGRVRRRRCGSGRGGLLACAPWGPLGLRRRRRSRDRLELARTVLDRVRRAQAPVWRTRASGWLTGEA